MNENVFPGVIAPEAAVVTSIKLLDGPLYAPARASFFLVAKHFKWRSCHDICQN